MEKIFNLLRERYKISEFKNPPFQVLIGTILSQRTRDENTSIAWNALFSRYKTPKEIVLSSDEELQELIKVVGFYKVKVKRIKEVSKILIERYKGEVPKNISELLKLPGVGRKTANCVLAYGFGIPALPVDTHVHRVSNRIGLVSTKTPEETEIELKKVVPKRYWIYLNELFVKFGKDICKPINPKCNICLIRELCLTGKVNRLPPVFSKPIIELCRRILGRYNDILSLVLIGSVGEGDFKEDSDIDIVCIKKERLSSCEVINLEKDLEKKVQLIPFNEEEIKKHFKDSTTMAYSIKRGIILYERDNFLKQFYEERLSTPSFKWMVYWFKHWMRFYNLGIKDLEKNVEFHKKHCDKECYCTISDYLYRACVNFAILFIELQGFIPTTKGQIQKFFERIVKDEDIKRGLNLSLEAHHEDRDISLNEAGMISKTATWLKNQLEQSLC